MNNTTPNAEDNPSSVETEESLNHVMQARRDKLQRIQELGINPYPYSFAKSHSIEEIFNDFEALQTSEAVVKVAGRIASIRLMGKAAFVHIQEEAEKIQLYFKRDIIGEESWELFKLLDIGDILGLEGTPFRTRTDERTIKVASFTLQAKNLRPLPAVKEKDGVVWFAWTDKEERYRNRAMDLLINPAARNILLNRSLIVREIRQFLDGEDFLEVETPILQPIYGGAAARPFVTHHNSLDQNFYLRIADELYLKRLIAGGFPRVYEISKDFRNEGIDRMHSPEFTMMECYAAWEDYNYVADLIERMIVRIASKILPQPEITFADKVISLKAPFKRATMSDLLKEACGVEIIARKRDDLAAEAKGLGIAIDKSWGVGKIIDEIFSQTVEPNLIDPTFVMDYPIELSPLAKRHRSVDGLVERFELFIGGMEVANAFSELNNPIDQRERFEEQTRLISEGDDEAHPIDENYLQSLELGMPPTGGLGMGVDRIVMLLTGASSLRDVILFPTLRNRE